MPRPRSTGKQQGIRRDSILRRRTRNAKKARLIARLQRFGIVTGMVCVMLWAGAWFWVSGGYDRARNDLAHDFYAVSADSGFAVQNLLVEGRVNADPDVLLGLVNVRRGDPILSVDPTDVKNLLERVSWIETAHVERRLPDTIYIRLTERVPLALWQDHGKIRVVDAGGVVLTDTKLDPFRNLLLIVGDDAPEHAADLVALLGAEPDLTARIEAAVWVGERRWDLKMKNGMAVRLPEKDVALALSRLVRAQDDDQILDKDLLAIDLRDNDRITVRTQPGAVQEYKASVTAAAAKGNDI